MTADDRTPDSAASLWMQTAPAPPRPTLTGTHRVDVAIVGAGITGLTTALRCVEQGLSVAVLEMGQVGQGVTGHTTAKVSWLHQLVYAELVTRLGERRARIYAKANQQAVQDVIDTIELYGIDCHLERRDAVTWTTQPDEVESLDREAQAAQRVGLPARLSTTADLPFDVAAALTAPDQVQVHPREYLLGMADAVDAADGSTVFEHSRVMGLRPGSPLRVSVGTARGLSGDVDGVVEARDVVVATHMPFFDLLGALSKSDVGGFFARLEPVRSYVVAIEATGDVPESMSISAGSPTRSLRTYDDGGRRHLLVGGESHRPGDDPDERRHWTALEEWARDRFELGQVTSRWSAQDFTSLDGMPYVGRMAPFSPHLWTATGYRKWGMTNATAAARIIAAGITEEDHPWAAAFEPSRPTLRASAGSFVRNQIAVARHLVGDRVRLPGRGAIDDLADGDGVVVRVGGSARAVSRHGDDLTCVSAVCTHLGCYVAWNTAERSWDCPCHGSRFAADGTVVQGPATRDLAPRPLPE